MVSKRQRRKKARQEGTDEPKGQVKKVFLGPVPADCSDLGIETKPEYVVPSSLLRRSKKHQYAADELVCPVCGSRAIMTANGEWVCPNCGLVVRQATLEEFTGELEIGGEAYSPTPEKIEKYVALSYSDRDIFVLLNAVYSELYGENFDYLALTKIKESVAKKWNYVLKRWAEDWPNHKCNIAMLYKCLADLFVEKEAEKLGFPPESVEDARVSVSKKLSKVRPWELRFRCSSVPRGDERTCRKWLKEVLKL